MESNLPPQIEFVPRVNPRYHHVAQAFFEILDRWSLTENIFYFFNKPPILICLLKRH